MFVCERWLVWQTGQSWYPHQFMMDGDVLDSAPRWGLIEHTGTPLGSSPFLFSSHPVSKRYCLLLKLWSQGLVGTAAHSSLPQGPLRRTQQKELGKNTLDHINDFIEIRCLFITYWHFKNSNRLCVGLFAEKHLSPDWTHEFECIHHEEVDWLCGSGEALSQRRKPDHVAAELCITNTG